VGFGAIATAIGIVSGIVTIIGFFLPIATKNARLIHALYILVISILVGFGTFEATRYARLESIARNARQLNRIAYDNQYNAQRYIEAAMTFLEKSKDIYPDAYKRASDDYISIMRSPHTGQNERDLQERLQAIVNEEAAMASE
jgi:hypothetical protein